MPKKKAGTKSGKKAGAASGKKAGATAKKTTSTTTRKKVSTPSVKKAGAAPRQKALPSPKKKARVQPEVVEIDGLRFEDQFPIVGIGASAGGLEAFEQFFTNTPPDTGMAFALVQHLDPTHKSILTDLISRYTRMRVFEVEDGMTVEPNTVYVIPPNRYMALLHGKLHLLEPTDVPGLRIPVDYFFRSLAEDRKDLAIGIVLSGSGTEGTMGVRAIKGEGGMAMVQDPESAKYDGMPRGAMSTGLADYVLPPEAMPEQLTAYVKQAFGKGERVPAKLVPKTTDLLEKIFIIIRTQTGHDFSYYKHNTIVRRVERRMAVNQVVRMEDYVRYLQENPTEAETLFKELLIGVTNFFRDPEAWQALDQKVIPELLEKTQPDRALRIWIPGCATGEEAYSIAIQFKETMWRLKTERAVQIFATDIDTDAIEIARMGIYPDSIAVDVSSENLAQYFNRQETAHRVKKEIRDMVVFAAQNVITDPPFSRIDLICCRNLLIYLGSELQKRVLPLFHYSLKKGGSLFLGSSETIGEFSSLFSVVDRKWKLFKRRETGVVDRVALGLGPAGITDLKLTAQDIGFAKPVMRANYRDLTQRMILDKYGPTAVIINEKCEILHVQGRTGKYLEHVSGDFSGNIVMVAREGLRLELATGIRKVITQKKEIRIERLLVKTNGYDQLVTLVIKPISEPASFKGLMMVVFEDVKAETRAKTATKISGSAEGEVHPRIRQLEQELSSTKEYLQTTIEELETSNEELKSTNEELQSSNEELQSTNEELETSKEELQSVNEELTTVNSELQQKIDELSKAGSDMNNLLTSTDIGTIFLDTNLSIQRFTPAVTHFLNLIQSDIGRPVSHIVPNMDYEHLVEDAEEVLSSLITKELEVRTKDDRHYTMRILPYRTIENVIDGVVVTFMEITKLKELEHALRDSEERHRNLFNDAQVGLFQWRVSDGKFTECNDLLARVMGYDSRDECLAGNFLVDHYVEAENRAKMLEEIAERGEVKDYEACITRADGDSCWISFSARLYKEKGYVEGVVTDITEKRRAIETAKKGRKKA